MAHLLLLIGACWWIITPAVAQPATAPPAPLPPGPGVAVTTPAAAFGLPLRPGDAIGVVVAGEPAITGTYTIREDGRIVFPLVGPLQVSGFTAMQIADRLTTALQKYVRRPVVSVDIVSAQPRTVTILGDVPRPGAYDLRQAPTLQVLLAVAGSANPTADLPAAVIVREGEVTPLLKPGEMEPGPVQLHPGDVIAIPSRGLAQVNVVGAVRTPASYPLSNAATAGRALLLAGNALPEGDPAAAYVVRGGQRLPVDLSAETAAAASTPLEAGDMLIIPPRKEAYVYVLGEVRVPGALPVMTAGTATAAIARAGGTTSTASLGSAYILRQNQRMSLDLKALLQEGGGADVSLAPGDVLVVPPVSGAVYLMGQVVRPGPVAFQQAETAMVAWSQSGGATPDGDLRNAMLLRGNETIALDLEALERGDQRQNLPLQPGDRILVPRYSATMYVLGQVGTPGVQNIHPGDTLLDVLARAGGPTGQAAVNKIALVRRVKASEVAAERQRIAADEDKAAAEKLRQAMDCGFTVRFMDLAQARPGDAVFAAQPGDLLYIPAQRQPRVDWLQVLITLATALIIR